MNQKQRKTKRENELKNTIKKIKLRNDGMCEHCNSETATETAHNIPRNFEGYAFYSDIGNLHRWGRNCHSLYDGSEIYKFAMINPLNFIKLMAYLTSNIQYRQVRKLLCDKMDLYLSEINE